MLSYMLGCEITHVLPLLLLLCCRCCCSFYGLLLDNTKELRKTLEDGNAVIRNINILRNATCTPASFDPPTATPARITGMCGTMLVLRFASIPMHCVPASCFQAYVWSRLRCCTLQIGGRYHPY
jgi:hypothetical protein